MRVSNSRIVVVGESLIDRVRDRDSIREYVGGSPANVALGLGQLGHPVALLTQFGSDRFGAMIHNHLQHSMELIQCGPRDAATSTALVTVGAKGIPHYDFDLSWDVALPDFAAPDILHAGSLGAYLTPGHSEVARLVRQHAPHSTITFDPNLRPLIMDREIASRRLSEIAAYADVIKISDEDLAWLHPGTAPETLVTHWLAEGVALVALTRGDKGADIWTSRAHTTAPASKVRVVDTVGAGDAFMAGLIDALCALTVIGSNRTSELANLSQQHLRAIIKHATTAAALALESAGAQPPTRAGLGQFVV